MICPLGRNVDEMLRMIDSLQFTEEHGEVCPAGWQEGDKGMAATSKGVAEYLAEKRRQTLGVCPRIEAVARQSHFLIMS